MTQLQLRGQLRAYVISAHTACSLSGPVFASQEHLSLSLCVWFKETSREIRACIKDWTIWWGLKRTSCPLGYWENEFKLTVTYDRRWFVCVLQWLTLLTAFCVWVWGSWGYVLNLKSTWCIFRSCYSISHSWIKFPVLYYKTITKNVYFQCWF